MDVPTGDILVPQAPPRAILLSVAPLVIGWMLNFMFYGFGLSLYFQFRTDQAWKESSKLVQRLMTSVAVLNTLHCGFNVAEMLHKTALPDRSLHALYSTGLADCFPGLTQAGITGLVTAYLAERSMRLVRSRIAKAILTTLFVIGTAVEVAGSVAVSVVAFIQFTRHRDRLDGFNRNHALGMFSGASAFTDCLVTATLCVCLSREITGLNRKKDTIARYILRLALRTAAYTAIFALVGFILAFAFGYSSPYGSLFMVFLFPLPSLAMISLFVTIDSSKNVRAAVPPNRRTSTTLTGEQSDHFKRGDTEAVEIYDQYTVQLESLPEGGCRENSDAMSGAPSSSPDRPKQFRSLERS